MMKSQYLNYSIRYFFPIEAANSPEYTRNLGINIIFSSFCIITLTLKQAFINLPSADIKYGKDPPNK